MAARTPKTPTAERTRKTPAEKAQHALDVEQRRVEKLETKVQETQAAYRAAQDSLEAATKRRDYLAQSPDLPQPTLDGDTAPEPDGDA